jgi:uncharacterized protein (TIGR00369 family)
MQDATLLAALNERTPNFIRMLGGKIVAVDKEASTTTFEFNVSTDFCHSVNVVQGGFITVMLDAAMSHAVFASGMENLSGVSSLEIKTSYLEPTLAGRMRAIGRIRKAAYKTAFLEAELYNADGVLTATASSVAKLTRGK